MILAGTGHRPEKLTDPSLVRKRIAVTLRESRPKVVISGMAAGFDLMLAHEAIHAGINVWAVRPWAGHRPRAEDYVLYHSIIDHAAKIVNVNESFAFPGNWVYQRRNEWMVNEADRILAWWDGTPSGTANCIKYANKVHKPVRNLYEKG